MPIKIYPEIEYISTCPTCKSDLRATTTLWQGMHICVKTNCTNCSTSFFESLPIAHAIHLPYQIDQNGQIAFKSSSEKSTQGKMSELKSLKDPQDSELDINVELIKPYNKVIVLNCIDFMYGHCLLKLLNAQRHLEDQSNYGLIVIVQPFLRWMVPKGVAEVWTVNLPLRQGNLYYPNFNQFVQNELKRFSEVYLSEAYSHPSRFDITKFTGVNKHEFNQKHVLITYVWREDRLWCHPFLERRQALKRLRLYGVILWLQNWRIRQLFKQIHSAIPEANFAVAGLGTKTSFPQWIKDARVESFDALTEKQTCQLYSDSRLIIGVHGSSMLLPSAHAGMTIDLMPKDRWGNFAQDIIYQENDPRLSSFKYRYLPITANVSMIAYIAIKMVTKYLKFQSYMVN